MFAWGKFSKCPLVCSLAKANQNTHTKHSIHIISKDDYLRIYTYLNLSTGKCKEDRWSKTKVYSLIMLTSTNFDNIYIRVSLVFKYKNMTAIDVHTE